MRRFLRRAAPVFVIMALQTGCCSTPALDPDPDPDPTPTPILAPDVSWERGSPQPREGFALADPGYVIYDLSRLRIGMTKAEVQKLFLRPHVVKQAPKDEYWEYDWFELYFREGRLVNWFDLPESRQKVRPSNRSSQAGRRDAFGEL